MKKETIHLICMIILCIVTIPFVTYAQEQPSKPRRRLVEIVEETPEPEPEAPLTDCGYNRPIKVAGFVFNPPFSWVERTDKDALTTYGYSLDVFKKIADKMGWKYESVGFTSYDETLGALKRGEIDLILSAYLPQGLGYGITPVYPAYFTNIVTVYFHKGKSIPFHSIEELANFRGIMRREENLYRLFKNKKTLANLKLRQVTPSQKAFEMLLNDEADYLIGSPYAIEAELRRFKLKNDIISSQVVVLEGGGSLFFVLSSNTSCVALKEQLSKEVKEYLYSGVAESEIRSAIDTWGEEFRNEPGLLSTNHQQEQTNDEVIDESENDFEDEEDE
ncbi:MAG: transporter substrate-binding domain-containing protein [Alphaproteobacteria bacterium]|nr:transporter substrate-binding domain-containing protein [Alphaproteobacteria bacterium]